MANTGSQAEAIRDLLVERMELFDPTVDTAEGSEFWSTVVDPVFQALGVDPFDVDVETFLLTRLRQEYPTVAANVGDAIVDLLCRPNQALLEPWKREVQIIRRGQSVKNTSTMRDEDADALAANWFVVRREGTKVSGVVRVYYASPTYVAVTSSVTFSTSGGLRFVPTTPQYFRAETMLLQKSGTYYYVDVSVVAEAAGTDYEVDAGTITQVAGLTGAARVANIFAFRGGVDRETNVELMTRTQKSLTERSLNTRRGIFARLMGQFTGIRNLEVVGYGDPEMTRDIVEGTGEGHVRATGTCFVVGQFCLMFSQYEDRGLDGTTAIEEGDTINLNYWKLLYDLPDDEQHEEFTIEDILFDSRDTISNLPSILLFRLSAAPSVAKSVLGMLPGTLPAVFCVVKGSGKITISSMPGGILDPDTDRGTVEIDDASIHIGGHYDVWIRPSSDVSQTGTVDALKSTSIVVEGTSLVTNGQDSSNKNRIYNIYKVTYKDRDSGETISLGQTVTGVTSGATATVTDHAASSNGRGEIELAVVSGLLESGEEITVGSTATLTLTSVTPTLEDAGVVPGMLLAILSGSDVGTYRIVAVDGTYAYLDTDLTVSEVDVHFRVVSEVIIDAFSPKEMLVPFGDAAGDDLISVIGSERVRVGVNLLQYGVEVGDTLEILEGEDKGSYTIDSFDTELGASAPLLSAALTASNSGAHYRIYRQQTGLQPPLVRIPPGGVTLLDPSGQDSGYTIPYALPVDGRAKGAFSGAEQTIAGKNGFILPDPGTTWEPTSSVTAVETDGLDTRSCYSDECLDCDGYIACVTVMADGTFYINSGLPPAAQNFFNDLKGWILNVINTFELGDDARAFVHGLSPFTLGAPVEALDYTTGIGNFEVGETLTGDDSSATAVVTAVTHRLRISGTTGTFEDGETITGGTSGATATITIISDSELLLASVTGIFEAETVTGGTSGATATVTDHVGTVSISSLVGTFQDGEVIRGGTSSAAAEIEIVVASLLQFEICIPSELFDGCNNVFVAMPEFDWEATLGSAESLADAVGLYTSGDLNGSAPALASAAAGDSLTILSGANAGSYIIHKVYNYRLCSAGSVVEGVVDLTKCYQVVAVVIDGEFPVPSLGGLSDFFASGIPDLDSLPAPPSFPGTSYDDDGNSQSPWEWVALFLDWLLKFLVSMGFDLPESVELDAQETLKSLWQMLFSEYVVGKTTAQQYARVYFVEPTSMTVHGPRPCLRYTYALPVTAGVSLEGEDFTVPMADLEGVLATVELRGISGGTLLSGELPADVATVETIEALAAVLQETLDADQTYVVFSGPATATGTLTVTSVEEGVDVYLYMDAENLGDAFRWLGFYGPEGEEWAQVASTTAPTYFATHISLDPATTAGFRVQFTAATVTYASDVNLSYGLPAGTNVESFIELAALMETKLFDAIDFWNQISDLDVSVTWDDGTNTFVVQITGTEFSAIQLMAPSGLTTNLMVPLFGGAGPIAGVSGTPWTFVTATPSPFAIYDLEATVVDAAGTYNLATTFTYTEAVSFDDAIEAAIAGSFDDLAIALNAFEDAYSDGTERRIWFVGGTHLYVRSVPGKSTTSLTLTVGAGTDGYRIAGFPNPSTDTGANGEGIAIGQGSTTPDTTVTEVYHPPEATLFSVSVGSAELLFCASGDADPYQVFPGQTAEGEVAATDLPRDILVSSPYDDALSAIVRFSDTSYESPVALGITKGADYLYLYEQRFQLDFTIGLYESDLAQDRVPAVMTTAGSAVVKLPSLLSPEFTFLQSGTQEDDDVVQVGDILFLEEGDDAGGYVVTARTSKTEVTLDRALTTSSGTVYRVGNDGVIAAGTATITTPTAAFSSADIGRYLTIWGSNRKDFDGSYRITAVDTSDPSNTVATLDTTEFASDEVDIHWAVVKAPTEDPADSSTGGRTSLVGLRPFRIYKGTPTQWLVVAVDTSLDRTSAEVTISYGDSTTPPKKGVKQPYQFVRPGMQRISSTAMSSNLDNGLYYFDILAKSLGGDELFNIPETTRMEPVFGTYFSDGYYYNVTDNRFAFSPYEELSLVFTPYFLPKGNNDTPDNLVGVEGRGIRMTYELAPLVDQVQRFMVSEDDRVLCANPLVRHFLPSYVYLTVEYTGGNASATIAADLIDTINSMEPTDALDVSVLEGVLNKNGVKSYEHPIEIVTVTHDLDRRLVAMRSTNRIGEDVVDFNGTNRTTFFIAGDDASATTDETDIPDGERTRLVRLVAKTTIR